MVVKDYYNITKTDLDRLDEYLGKCVSDSYWERGAKLLFNVFDKPITTLSEPQKEFLEQMIRKLRT